MQPLYKASQVLFTPHLCSLASHRPDTLRTVSTSHTYASHYASTDDVATCHLLEEQSGVSLGYCFRQVPHAVFI